MKKSDGIVIGDAYGMKLNKLKYLAIGIAVLVALLFFTRPRRNTCGPGLDRLTVSTVAYGCFVEFIPQTGVVEVDTTDRCHNVKVPIDELYLARIEPGLKVTTTFNNRDYELAITNVYSTVSNGRFEVEMNFCDELPARIVTGTTLRLRIELGDSSTQLLLPVGGFYKDTGGKWIYIVENGGVAVRRNIKLGRKSGAEYFEVLAGLKPGDNVITSSYENYNNVDSLDVEELRDFAKANFHF